MLQRKPLSLCSSPVDSLDKRRLAHPAHRNKNKKSGQFMCYINRTVSGAFYSEGIMGRATHSGNVRDKYLE